MEDFLDGFIIEKSEDAIVSALPLSTTVRTNTASWIMTLFLVLCFCYDEILSVMKEAS